MELFQEIVTYLIIAGAVGYTVYQFVKIVLSKAQNNRNLKDTFVGIFPPFSTYNF